MTKQQLILLTINFFGGTAVILSYLLGIRSHPGSGSALWGGVPNWLRPIYGISMLIAALGYLCFIYYILFRIIPAEMQIANKFGFSIFYPIFLGILVPSALWMPLTFKMISQPSSFTWAGIRIVLIIVGLASCVLVWALLNMQVKASSLPYWLAVAGSVYFAFHTAFLDMVLWPLLFRAES